MANDLTEVACIEEMFETVAAEIAEIGFPPTIWPDISQLHGEILRRLTLLGSSGNNSPPAMFFCLWDVFCWLLASAPPDVRRAAIGLFRSEWTEENIERWRR